MTRYANGAAFERSISKTLSELGWWTGRIAGSHGEADVVAISPDDVLLVQCKTSGSIPPHERRSLYEAAQRCGGTAIVVSREQDADDRRRTRLRWRQVIDPASSRGWGDEWEPYRPKGGA